MPTIRDLPYCKARRDGSGKVIHYGAPTPDGPWYRLTAHEVRLLTRASQYLATVQKRDTLPDSAN